MIEIVLCEGWGVNGFMIESCNMINSKKLLIIS